MAPGEAQRQRVRWGEDAQFATTKARRPLGVSFSTIFLHEKKDCAPVGRKEKQTVKITETGGVIMLDNLQAIRENRKTL